MTNPNTLAALPEWLLVVLCALMLATAYWLVRQQRSEAEDRP